jgi:Immunity protein Imm1
MNVEFIDREDERNPLSGSIISESPHLHELFEQLRGREPFFCELVGQNGYKILLGIGGPSGCVQYSRIDGSPPYLMAVAEDLERSREYVEFLIGGTLTPVSSRYCASFKTVTEIAAYFQTTGERSPLVSWEEV